ncbi:MmcQ/YjbR family DNA-binding protein [Globicatella sanguinis]|uniref:MmcQ/YjbR family DNA-binding protein n=1 Tax=Globicatella sanguinis TaxID=13076 RepID=UPI002543ACC3|nr:MmcQ/YjbR family DNA-binding protein [Globicatella sanguinis]MDK7631689.1 MmcQ/YjbR family DNA-binding protein [Globicatella sanguinis]WIK65854.1 MmcQ/YjbR family DNA-binding protein [Globicatella sanguinis]WKT55259.1 MmcQ/YjbR family DNA-binding protein [Globicatella sanguinis]
MRYLDSLVQKQFIPPLALKFGFKKTGPETFEINQPLKTSDFEVQIMIDHNEIKLTVFELPERLEYLPFNLNEDEGGSFVNQIRSEVNEVMHQIIELCYQLKDFRKIVFDFVRAELNTKLETPWAKHPEFYLMKTANRQKWYGLMMRISYQLLDSQQPGIVDVLNLKAPPLQIVDLIDHQTFYPAYHMNKKHWVSVVVDEKINLEQLQALIRQSYQLVEG